MPINLGGLTIHSLGRVRRERERECNGSSSFSFSRLSPIGPDFIPSATFGRSVS